MSEFKPVTLESKPLLQPYLQASDFRGADYCVNNMLMWGVRSDPHYTIVDDRLIIRLRNTAGPAYLFPPGTGPIENVLDYMKADSVACGADKLFMRCVPAPMHEELERIFPGRFSFEPARNSFDYIYATEQLANLAGKKLHGKRNHINRFLQENTWSFEPVTTENLPICRELVSRWMEQTLESREEDFSSEQTALNIAFDHFEEMHFEGGLLRANGEYVAFTMGEVLSSDTYIVHFEKAYAQINGAYPMINREFVRYIASLYPQIRYFNREEDMGHENLRKAKLSYYPTFMVEKYSVLER